MISKESQKFSNFFDCQDWIVCNLNGLNVDWIFRVLFSFVLDALESKCDIVFSLPGIN